MYRRLLTVVIPVLAVTAVGTYAAPEQWPTSMEVGGFRITDIKGTVNEDGSGRARGRLQIPGDGSCPVDLARTASGMITGSARASFTLAGVRIDGSFLLDRRGLQGTGLVHTQGRPVADANLTVDPKGVVTGKGRVNLGSGFSISASCEVGQKGASVRGSASRQASVDTPLAVYIFKGNVEVSAAGTALTTTARGLVERKGKVGGVVSTFGPVSFPVDPSNGEAKLNVGGANITIDLW